MRQIGGPLFQRVAETVGEIDTVLQRARVRRQRGRVRANLRLCAGNICKGGVDIRITAECPRGNTEPGACRIRTLDRESFLSQIALVPQETLLFGGTVKENILYGKLEATDTELKEAAQKANAHEFIMEMEKGYDSIVGEKGTKLSGGERQRISIARAILKDPKILVLDEATSSLDNRSESLIQEALETLMAHRTTFIVAHRLSTIHKANQIIVLDKGRIVESGQHEDLMNHKGLYHSLYTMKMLDPAAQEELGL